MTTLLAKTKCRIEISPGREIDAEIPREAVPRYGIVTLMRQTDGTYVPHLRTWGDTMRLKSDTAAQLGLDVSYNTLRRLIQAGFIKGHLVAPETFLLDLESLYLHLENTRDPEWWTEARKATYKAAFRCQIA